MIQLWQSSLLLTNINIYYVQKEAEHRQTTDMDILIHFWRQKRTRKQKVRLTCQSGPRRWTDRPTDGHCDAYRLLNMDKKWTLTIGLFPLCNIMETLRPALALVDVTSTLYNCPVLRYFGQDSELKQTWTLTLLCLHTTDWTDWPAFVEASSNSMVALLCDMYFHYAVVAWGLVWPCNAYVFTLNISASSFFSPSWKSSDYHRF